MNEKGSPIILIVCVLIMGAVCGGLFFLRKSTKEQPVPAAVPAAVVAKVVETVKEIDKEKSTSKPLTPGPDQNFEPEIDFESSSELAKNFEHGLLNMESEKDLEELLKNMGVTEMSDSDLKTLFNKLGRNGANLKRGNRLDEIGELERRMKSRWSLNLEDGSRVFFDVKKGDDGRWLIDKIHHSAEATSLEAILEKGNVAQLDGLMVAHSFVQFAIMQEFSNAKQLVDVTKMSDVQLAGLCIIFAEGGYQLRKPRGVLTSIEKPTVSGYSVYIQSKDQSVAEFSLLLSREQAADPWRVVELNFNSLLADFIKSNGGNAYYTPFVKNPQGGDSIVVYFDFNTNQLSARTQRQLSIVANILKLDNSKKITLTGHTDSKGDDAYNRELSKKRADAVRDFLVSQGVAKAQITTVGFGAHRPREANTLADGTDNPEGRKVNRRAELYLDF